MTPDEGRWLLVNQALKRRAFNELSEVAVLEVVAEANLPKQVLPICCALLGNVGTASSRETLKKLTQHSSKDVKCSALLALMRVAGASEISTFIRALEEGDQSTKEYAILSISAVGDVTSLSTVSKFVMAALKKRKSLPQVFDPKDPPGLLVGLQFLTRFVGNEVSDSVLKFFHERSSVFLESEISWIRCAWGKGQIDIPILRRNSEVVA